MPYEFEATLMPFPSTLSHVIMHYNFQPLNYQFSSIWGVKSNYLRITHWVYERSVFVLHMYVQLLGACVQSYTYTYTIHI